MENKNTTFTNIFIFWLQIMIKIIVELLLSFSVIVFNMMKNLAKVKQVKRRL